MEKHVSNKMFLNKNVGVSLWRYQLRNRDEWVFFFAPTWRISPRSGFSPDGFSSTFLGLCFGVSKWVEEFRSFLNPEIFQERVPGKKCCGPHHCGGFTSPISAKLWSKRFTRPKIRMAMENHHF